MSLLRKTRFKNLLDADSKKLTVFMLAELILITLGISIALQFDQWKEHQDKLDKEVVLLGNLQIEFEIAESVIVNAITELDSLDKSRFKLYKNCGYNQDDLTEFELVNLVATSCGIFSLKISSGVLNNAMISGKFTLLQNDILRAKLFDWEAKLKQIQYQIMLVNEQNVLFLMYSSRYLSFRDLDHLSYPEMNLQNSVLSNNPLKILNDLRFENHIGNVSYQGRQFKRMYNDELILPLKDILRMLEEEVELKTQ